MNPEEIDLLIKSYEEQLDKLKPTLNAVSIPYSKIGLLNTARRKEKKYNKNITILKLARLTPVSDTILNALMEK